jgi:hypothetical protein
MPDQYGFDHLVNRGDVTHRCVVEGCDWPGFSVRVSETDRARHARTHERERTRATEKARKDALAKARAVKRQHARENTRAYGE